MCKMYIANKIARSLDLDFSGFQVSGICRPQKGTHLLTIKESHSTSSTLHKSHLISRAVTSLTDLSYSYETL
jgi:hypothetical protein